MYKVGGGGGANRIDPKNRRAVKISSLPLAFLSGLCKLLADRAIRKSPYLTIFLACSVCGYS